jgi:hypothetical protein
VADDWFWRIVAFTAVAALSFIASDLRKVSDELRKL